MLTSRAIRIALVAVLSASFAIAMPAEARVMTTSITRSTLKPWDIIYALNNSPIRRTVSGTSDGTLGDSLTLECLNPIDNSVRATLASAVTVGVQGTWTAHLTVNNSFMNAMWCRLAAVPDGPPANQQNLASFSGPTVALVNGQILSDSNGSTVKAFAAQWDLSTSKVGLLEISPLCGFCASFLRDPSRPSRERDGSLRLWANVAKDSPGVAVTQPSFPNLSVDGNESFAPRAAQALLVLDYVTFPGSPSASFSIRRNKTNGDTLITEVQDLTRCSGGIFPATEGNCLSMVPVGVRWTRTWATARDGLVVGIRDSFASTDSKPHSVRRVLSNGTAGGFETMGYRLGASGSYSAVTGDTSLNLNKVRPAVLGIISDRSQLPRFTNPVGEQYFSMAPSLLQIGPSTTGQWFATEQLSVKATRPATSCEAFTTAPAQTDLARLRPAASLMTAGTPCGTPAKPSAQRLRFSKRSVKRGTRAITLSFTDACAGKGSVTIRHGAFRKTVSRVFRKGSNKVAISVKSFSPGTYSVTVKLSVTASPFADPYAKAAKPVVAKTSFKITA